MTKSQILHEYLHGRSLGAIARELVEDEGYEFPDAETEIALACKQEGVTVLDVRASYDGGMN